MKSTPPASLNAPQIFIGISGWSAPSRSAGILNRLISLNGYDDGNFFPSRWINNNNNQEARAKELLLVKSFPSMFVGAFSCLSPLSSLLSQHSIFRFFLFLIFIVMCKKRRPKLPKTRTTTAAAKFSFFCGFFSFLFFFIIGDFDSSGRRTFFYDFSSSPYGEHFSIGRLRFPELYCLRRATTLFPFSQLYSVISFKSILNWN